MAYKIPKTKPMPESGSTLPGTTKPPSKKGGGVPDTSVPEPPSLPGTRPSGDLLDVAPIVSPGLQNAYQPVAGPTGNSPNTPYSSTLTAEGNGLPAPPTMPPPQAPVGPAPMTPGSLPNLTQLGRPGAAFRTNARFSSRFGSGASMDIPEPILAGAGTPYTDPNREDFLKRLVMQRVGGA